MGTRYRYRAGGGGAALPLAAAGQQRGRGKEAPRAAERLACSCFLWLVKSRARDDIWNSGAVLQAAAGSWPKQCLASARSTTGTMGNIRCHQAARPHGQPLLRPLLVQAHASTCKCVPAVLGRSATATPRQAGSAARNSGTAPGLMQQRAAAHPNATAGSICSCPGAAGCMPHQPVPAAAIATLHGRRWQQ